MRFRVGLRVLLLILAVHLTRGQETGDLRLVEGGADYEGNLQIYLSGGWGTVCAPDNDRPIPIVADTACRQLGYSRARSVYQNRRSKVNGVINRLICPLHADHLYDNCTHIEDRSFCNALSLSCRDNTNPLSGDVRLVDSAGSTDVSVGRVEVFYEGAWATLCDIDGQVANSVCWQTVRGRYHHYGNVTQLGFSTGSSAVILDIDSCDSSFLHYYDYNVVSIFILNITDDCSIRTALQCSHESDAAVECVACASEALCDGTPNCDRCVDECHCNNPEIFIDKRDVGSSVREKQTSDFCRSECVCNEDEFQCVESGVCILASKMCDGRHRDCSDNSDEDNPECLRQRQEAEEALEDLGRQRVGMVVGVLLAVLLLLLGPALLLLCLPCSPLRNLYSRRPQQSRLDTHIVNPLTSDTFTANTHTANVDNADTATINIDTADTATTYTDTADTATINIDTADTLTTNIDTADICTADTHTTDSDTT